MNRARTRTARRRVGAVMAAATVASFATVPGALPASASGYTTNCPKAENLVSGTAWSYHTLANGVTLKEGRHSDSRGYVRMHLLSINLTNTKVSIHPLLSHLSVRRPLSRLAANKPRLIAATNTGFFDFMFNAPLGSLVSHNTPLIATSAKQNVVGFTSDHRVAAGRLWTTGSVTVGTSTHAIVGLNVLYPQMGLTVYTPQWGSGQIYYPRGTVSRFVSSGVISSTTGRYDTPPSSGYLLVARGTNAVTWLQALKRGVTVTIRRTIKTDAPAPLPQAYAVSTQLVLPGGVARTGLTCRRSYPQPARMAIGWANGGRRLLLLQVEDKPGTSLHGLDADQMSRLLVNLGAKNAWSLDGSGSAEMLARLRSDPTRLSMRNYPSDGEERPIPVGMGIYYG